MKPIISNKDLAILGLIFLVFFLLSLHLDNLKTINQKDKQITEYRTYIRQLESCLFSTNTGQPWVIVPTRTDAPDK